MDNYSDRGGRLSASQKLSRKISIAIGIYMARYNLTEDQAFNEIRAYVSSPAWL